ncbi:MAG: hypothetical protein HeimC2_34850 [Candidatus Heimdallarchaeota archaeon LC_2]|nr:MAG: hypothetical protein HeimC2_34850 [Candidatus Heimdallarchaeota archaeon LC_2]
MNELVDDLFNLHLKVLQQILIGTDYTIIKKIFGDEFIKLNYEDFIINKAHRLTFDGNNQLIGAYPVSPIPNDFKVSVEGIGAGYAMCAVDALGIAYTFMQVTIIETKDQGTGKSISLRINPYADDIENEEVLLTYPSQGYDSLRELVAENTQLATSSCPNILFYSKNHLPKNNQLSVLSFKRGLEEAIAIFSQQAMKDHFRISLIQ